MIKYFTKITLFSRVNNRDQFTDNFINILLNRFKFFYSKFNMRYNFLITLKVKNKSNITVVYTPFMFIESRNVNLFILKIKDNLKHLNSLKVFENFRDVSLSILRTPLSVKLVISKLPSGILHVIPNSMDKFEWDYFLQNHPFIKLLKIEKSSYSGWIENEIHLLDLRTKENILITDIRGKYDRFDSFLRFSKGNITHYVHGNIAINFSIKHNPLYTNLNKITF